jgi:signal transduction histidine kinase
MNELGIRMNLFRLAILLTLSALLGVLAPFVAVAGDAIVLKSYYEDATGKKSFAEVKDMPFIPYEGVFSRGYSDANFWFRLRIDPAVTFPNQFAIGTDNLVLRIRPPYLREVEFFDPSFDQGRHRLTGDLYPSSGDEYRSWNLTFVMPAGTEARDVFVRMKTSSSTLINFEAYSYDEIVMVDFLQSALFELFIFLVILTILCALFISLYSGIYISRYFLVQQVAVLFWALAVFGLTRFLIPSLHFNHVLFMNLTVVAVSLLSELFHYNFLKAMGSGLLLQRAQLALMTVPIIAAVLVILGSIQVAMKINIFAALVFITFSTAGSFLLDSKPIQRSLFQDIPKWVIVAVYSTVFVFTMSTLLPQLGIIKAEEFAVYSLTASSFGSSVLFTIVLLFQFYQIKQREQLLEQDLAHHSDLLHLEKMSREDQSALLAMLSHELKTPLAGIQMSLASGAISPDKMQRINKAIRDMTAVIDRCSTVNKIDDGALSQMLSPVAFERFVTEAINARAMSQNIKCSIDKGIVLSADRQLLNVIVTNLLDNADKYSSGAGVVTVEARHCLDEGQRQGVELIVANEPRPDLWPAAEQLFKKYYRAEGAHRVAGSGLGLYLVHKVVEALGGSIIYAPTDTHVRFRLWLPV